MTTSTSREVAGITPRQMELLHILIKRQQMSVGEIAMALGISSAAATKAITRLERKGLVTRTIDIVDRRSVKVRLTRRGIELTRHSIEDI